MLVTAMHAYVRLITGSAISLRNINRIVDVVRIMDDSPFTPLIKPFHLKCKFKPMFTQIDPVV
jgi:hypothetical protein